TTTTAPTGSARQGGAPAPTSTAGPGEHSYTPIPATPTPKPSPSTSQPSEPTPSGEPGGGKPPPEATKETSHEVASGESLWTIARNRLEHAAAGGSGEPTADEVTRYWERVKEVNQGRLDSRDPDIIKTGERVILPPVESSATAPAPKAHKEMTRPAAPGDSLWTLARDHLAAVGNREPSTRQVAAYWEKVKAANRSRLQSRDPDVIEIGEPIVLPPVD
ncbi:MAG: LysM peptidoglycan-binding domain-containing protein, partial [Actinomycetes bacterium]